MTFPQRTTFTAIVLLTLLAVASPADSQETDEPIWRLPIPAGEQWSVGGPHPDNGEIVDCWVEPSVCNALDFAPGADSDGRVLAMAAGTVSWQTCGAGRYLRIDHGDGWATTYYHLSAVRDGLAGSHVEAGEFLGIADITIPCGGFASGEHAHVAFTHQGRPVPVSGRSIGGYTVHSGRQSYHGTWVRDSDGETVVTAEGLTAFGIDSDTAFSARPLIEAHGIAIASTGRTAVAVVVRSNGDVSATRVDAAPDDSTEWTGVWEEIPGHRDGGRIVGRPAAEIGDDGSTHVVAVTDTGALVAAHRPTGGRWGGWTDLGQPGGGVSATAAEVVVAPDASVLAIVIGNDGDAHVRRRTATRWGPWQSVGGSDLVGSPTTLALPNGTIHLFATSTDGSVRRTHRVAGGGWRDWSDLGTVPNRFSTSPPAAARTDDGALHVVATDREGIVHLVTRSTRGEWGDWSATDLTSRGDATLFADGRRIEVAAVDTDGRFVRSERDGDGRWRALPATPNPSAPFSDELPAVVRLGTRTPIYVITAADGRAWSIGEDAPTPIPGSPDDLTPSGDAAESPSSGYWLLDESGQLYDFGDAAPLGRAEPAALPPSENGPVAVSVATTNGTGVWVLFSDGRIVTRGDAAHHGDLRTVASSLGPGEAAASIAALPDGSGYWIFTTAGRVVPFGAGGFHGDMRRVELVAPVIASASTPSGRGYVLLAGDGGIFTFGDATFSGSVPETISLDALDAPLVGLATDPDGVGYWLVAADGGIFAFDAAFRGSVPGALPPGAAMRASATSVIAFHDGYLVVGEDGGIFNFSSEPFLGSLGADPPPTPIRAVAAFVASSSRIV